MMKEDVFVKYILRANDPAEPIFEARVQDLRAKIIQGVKREKQKASILSLFLKIKKKNWFKGSGGQKGLSLTAVSWRPVAALASVFLILGFMVGNNLGGVMTYQNAGVSSSQEIYYTPMTSSWGGWVNKGD